MKTYKIGVWIDHDYVREFGGGYSFQAQMINGIDNREFGDDIEIFFIGFNLTLPFKKKTINIPFTESFLEQKRTNFYHKLFKSHVPRRDIQRNYNNAINILKHNQIDLICYVTQNRYIENYPFIIVHWDLGHKTTYPFPEMAMDGNWERREESISKNLNKAILIGCESEQGKHEIIENYKIFEKKVKILPLFPGQVVNDETNAKTPSWIKSEEKFFFYPAQFWAHKNHYNLVLAFKYLTEKYPDHHIKLILTGSEQGTQAHIKKVINDLNLKHEVIFPGFVSDEELKWLYLNAMGMIFPSFLGPTNMPLLEANYLNCNFACANHKGHLEMIGDNALYFDPENPKDILACMIDLVHKSDAQIKIKKVELKTKYSVNNSLQILEGMFKTSMNIRNTWGN